MSLKPTNPPPISNMSNSPDELVELSLSSPKWDLEKTRKDLEEELRDVPSIYDILLNAGKIEGVKRNKSPIHHIFFVGYSGVNTRMLFDPEDVIEEKKTKRMVRNNYELFDCFDVTLSRRSQASTNKMGSQSDSHLNRSMEVKIEEKGRIVLRCWNVKYAHLLAYLVQTITGENEPVSIALCVSLYRSPLYVYQELREVWKPAIEECEKLLELKRPKILVLAFNTTRFLNALAFLDPNHTSSKPTSSEKSPSGRTATAVQTPSGKEDVILPTQAVEVGFALHAKRVHGYRLASIARSPQTPFLLQEWMRKRWLDEMLFIVFEELKADSFLTLMGTDVDFEWANAVNDAISKTLVSSETPHQDLPISNKPNTNDKDDSATSASIWAITKCKLEADPPRERRAFSIIKSQYMAIAKLRNNDKSEDEERIQESVFVDLGTLKYPPNFSTNPTPMSQHFDTSRSLNLMLPSPYQLFGNSHKVEDMTTEELVPFSRWLKLSSKLRHPITFATPETWTAAAAAAKTGLSTEEKKEKKTQMDGAPTKHSVRSFLSELPAASHLTKMGLVSGGGGHDKASFGEFTPAAASVAHTFKFPSARPIISPEEWLRALHAKPKSSLSNPKNVTSKVEAISPSVLDNDDESDQN